MVSGCRTTEEFFNHTVFSNNSSPDGTTVKAWDDGATNPLAQDNIYNKTYELQFTTENPTETLDSITAEKQDYQRAVITNVSVKDKKTLDINLNPITHHYNHSITINLKSDEAGEGHLVRDSPIILTNSEGTKNLNTTTQTITYSWTSDQETENITYDINPSGTGHQDISAKQTSIGTTKTIDEILAANDFTGDITYNIKDQESQNVTGALVTTAQSKSGTTSTNGNVTLTGFVISENNYSEPTTTNITHTVTKTGYNTKNGSANINPGTNNVNETIEEIINTYQHALTINLLSSEASEGHLVRDSPIILTNSEGTKNLNTNNQTITYTWTSNQATENITYDINSNGNGHADVPAKSVSISTNLTENRTLTANDWTGNVPYHITDQTMANVEGANVAAGGKNGTTNTTGNVTLTGLLIAENTYSEPVTTNITTTVSGNGITTKQENHNITTGTNDKTINVNRNYNYTITFNLISSEAGEGHLVRDSPIVLTNSKGTTTLTTNNQTITYTWTSSLPSETITYDINPTGTGHQNPAAKQTNITPGNKTQNETLVANDFTGDITYNIKDQSNQNVTGALVSTSQSKSGTTNTSGNVTLLDYIITENNYSEPLTTSINHTVTKNGYTTKNGSANINNGSNNVNETIEAITNSFTINGRGHLIGAIIAGLPNEAIDYLKTGSIRITTKKDNTNHDIPINSQGYFNSTINGTYTTADSISITYVNNPLVTTNTFSLLDANKVASTGKIKNDNGTYVASANEPRFITHTARTTIGKLTGKNLSFIAFSDQAYNLPDDLANITGVTGHGIISYIGETVTFVNDTINPNTGSPLTPTQIQEQQAAIDFLAEQMQTRTGLTLAHTNKMKSDNTIWNNYTYKCIIYKTNIQAANTKYNVTATTFNASDAHTRPTEGFNMVLTEGSTAQQNTYDLIVGHNANCFVWDGTGTITDYSWEGDVAKNTSYFFPEAFFKKK